MKILRAYKTRIIINQKQENYFRGCVGAARFVYNWGLNDRIERYKQGLNTNQYEQKKRFNSIKRELCPWILEYPYVIIQEEFENLDAAYKNFFRRMKQGKEKAGFPKFKSRYKDNQSFSLRGCISVDKNKIRLPIIGWVKLAQKNYFPSDIKILKATVSERAGHWFVSMQVEEEIPDPEPREENIIGIDLGIKSIAVVSDGKVFDNPKTLNKYEKKLATLNRELSRRTKGGSNYNKTKQKVARLHYKIASIRNTNLHEISKYAVAKANPSIIVMEDLNVQGMMANRHLSKALTDASISELKRQIQYKAHWSGVKFVLADRWFASSKICSGCGSKKEKLKLSERIYVCDECGLVIDRDLNASINLASYKFDCEPVNGGGLPVELECNNALL